MEFLSNLEPLAIVLICGGLCVGGFVVMFLLSFVGEILELGLGVLEFFGEALLWGPLPGCGCIFVLVACGMCGALVWLAADVLATCGTPDAVNLCRLLP
ncbi:MAG: hypothetical protein ACOCX5_00990 [Chloroflexota bacterium]